MKNRTTLGQDKIYFPNLDAIRFIAAFMVYLSHGFTKSFDFLPIENTFFERFLYTICAGATGVSIFFVLSGFLITYLLITEYELNLTISIKKFYIRRFLRIWPLYFALIAFTFILYPFLKSFFGANTPMNANILYHLVFLSNFDLVNTLSYHPGGNFMSQDINWSVAVEEQFYLFWPLLFAFLPPRFWIYSIVFIIGISITFRIINYDQRIVLLYHTLSVLVDLGIGGLFAYLIKKHHKIRIFFEKSSTLTHTILFAFSFNLLLWRDVLFPFKYGAAIAPIFFSFSFALIISAQAITKSESIFNLRNLIFASKWGKYTYGIYLIHPIPLTIITIFANYLHFPLTNFIATFLYGLIGLILTLFLSKISYVFFESKFLKLKDKYAIIKTNNP